jgi:hypothetical protein
MPRGDTQREFAAAALSDGIVLAPQSFPWLCQRGHLALPDTAAAAATLLGKIYASLGGDLEALAGGRQTRLSGDFVHPPTGTLIEVDESQHFTSARLTSLEAYPDDLPLGFDLNDYRELCRRWRLESDGYYRTKQARGFTRSGRQKQRAYYDSLRDIATSAMGHPPLVRIDAPARDGRAAYALHRERLVTLLI